MKSEHEIEQGHLHHIAVSDWLEEQSSIPIKPIRTECAWCKRIIKDVPLDARGLSSGICPECFEAEKAKIGRAA